MSQFTKEDGKVRYRSYLKASKDDHVDLRCEGISGPNGSILNVRVPEVSEEVLSGASQEDREIYENLRSDLLSAAQNMMNKKKEECRVSEVNGNGNSIPDCYSVECPLCDADLLEKCVTSGGFVRDYHNRHQSRVEKWKERKSEIHRLFNSVLQEDGMELRDLCESMYNQFKNEEKFEIKSELSDEDASVVFTKQDDEYFVESVQNAHPRFVGETLDEELVFSIYENGDSEIKVRNGSPFSPITSENPDSPFTLN
jgi:hypothetical protein